VCKKETGCVDHCYHKGTLLLPGKNEQTGKCSVLYCFKDYTVEELGCETSKTSGCTDVKHDYTKNYPSCCNQICVNEEIEE
jgi:Single domain von Willebrand factor type C